MGFAPLCLAFCATAPTANGLPPALKHTLSLNRALLACYKLRTSNSFPHKCSLILCQLALAWNVSIYRTSSLYSLPNTNFYFTICKLCVILQSLYPNSVLPKMLKLHLKQRASSPLPKRVRVTGPTRSSKPINSKNSSLVTHLQERSLKATSSRRRLR